MMIYDEVIHSLLSSLSLLHQLLHWIPSIRKQKFHFCVFIFDSLFLLPFDVLDETFLDWKFTLMGAKLKRKLMLCWINYCQAQVQIHWILNRIPIICGKLSLVRTISPLTPTKISPYVPLWGYLTFHRISCFSNVFHDIPFQS